MKAEELLPEEQNIVNLNGQQVRKGTIGSFLLNCEAIVKGNKDFQIIDDLKEQALVLEKIGFFDILEIKIPEIKQILNK